jgi:uncharacterized protein DUF4832/uncharacterized protein DUF4874
MRRSTFHFLLILFLLSSFIMGCQPVSSSQEPDIVTHTYIATDSSILNPERGFFTPYELPGTPGFSPVRATGNTLVHLNIRLDDWRETDIPQDVLDDLDASFADIRDAGVKAIIRFAYNQGPYPDSEPDASKAQILRHIEQLTPLLQNDADVIAWVEAGFIGAWGEWHTSTHGLDNIQDKQEILFALLKALPETRMAQVRYPANIIEMFPNPADAAKARVAHHNDCFLSSNTDVGTYERDGVITIERDQAYLAELTRFTPMSGETCAPNPPRSECASTLQEMALLHFSAINEAYHKGILRSWEEGGCMEEINNRMGYRLSLTTADFNEQVRPGGVLNLTVNLQNIGFASIITERPLYVVLLPSPAGRGMSEGQGEGEYKVKLDVDARSWEPGSTSFNSKLHTPSNAEEGEYRLALWLPDGYESLRENPLYSIRFANENVWDEVTGFNTLGNISITGSAGGESERGNEFSVISAESQTERGILSFSSTSAPTHTSTSASSSGDLISDASIENDAGNLVIRFEFIGDAASYNGFQVFFDTDQNPKTGMSIEGIGADFLLENDTLSAYAGSGSDWNWTPVEIELMFSSDNQAAKWTLPAAAFGDSPNVDAIFQLVDTNWDTAFVTDKMTFTLK